MCCEPYGSLISCLLLLFDDVPWIWFIRAVIEEAGSEFFMDGKGWAIDLVFSSTGYSGGLNMSKLIIGPMDWRNTALNDEFSEAAYELFKLKTP